MHNKFGKDRACGSGDILADRETDTQTDILATSGKNIDVEFLRKTNRKSYQSIDDLEWLLSSQIIYIFTFLYLPPCSLKRRC